MSGKRSNIWAYSKDKHQSILADYEKRVTIPDDVLGKLFCFYVLHTTAPGLSRQSKDFAAYGWKGDIRRNGLGVSLDSAMSEQTGRFLIPREAPNYKGLKEGYLGQLFHYARLTDGPLRDFTTERVVMKATNQNNSWLRLFYRIRNCFAHGRFVGVNTKDGLGVSIIMEDADKFSITSRMVF